MSRVACQKSLDRVIAYLQCSGVEITADVSHQALILVDHALIEGGEQGVLEQAMALVPRYFEIPAPAVPELCPPIARGSIGYSDA